MNTHMKPYNIEKKNWIVINISLRRLNWYFEAIFVIIYKLNLF